MQVNAMTRDGLDAEGYIETCCAVEKISAVFRPVLEGTIALLLSTFEARIHSIYLYGSVATGQARVGQSDIDILVLFHDLISDFDLAKFKNVENILSDSYPSFVREVGLGAAPIQEAFTEAGLPGLGCFIKHLCVCVEGDDIRPLLPKFRPSNDVARGFNGDYATVTQARLRELMATNDMTAAQTIMGRICRKTLRTGFSLVMPRLGCWTTEVEASLAYFSVYYPEHRRSMTAILNWLQRPPEDKTEFLRTITPLAKWLSDEIERVIGGKGG